MTRNKKIKDGPNILEFSRICSCDLSLVLTEREKAFRKEIYALLRKWYKDDEKK